MFLVKLVYVSLLWKQTSRCRCAHQVLGAGSFGKVVLVRRANGTDEGQLYAMKVLEKHAVLSKQQLKYTLAERKILQSAHHPFLVRSQHIL